MTETQKKIHVTKREVLWAVFNGACAGVFITTGYPFLVLIPLITSTFDFKHIHHRQQISKQMANKI